MINSLDAKRGALANSATVAVFDEILFKNRIDGIENQMMHDAVPKISGKNFSPDRFFDHKANALSNFIFSVDNVVVQSKQFFLIVNLKSQGIGCLTLVFARIKIGAEQIKHKLLIVRIFHSLQVLDAPNGKPVRAVIVISWINTAGIKVQIVGVDASDTARPVVAVGALIVERATAVVAVAG